MAVDPAGKFVYAPDEDGALWTYSIDPMTGFLTQVSDPLREGQQLVWAVIHPSGKFAYVVDRGGDNLLMFSVDANTGGLTPLKQIAVYDSGQPFPITLDPSGQIAYVANEATNTVSAYMIGQDGSLNQYAAFATGSTPTSLAVVKATP